MGTKVLLFLLAPDSPGRLPDDSEAAARYWVAKGDWEYATGVGRAAVMPLLHACSGAPWNMKQEALRAPAQIGAPAAAPLIAALSDSNLFFSQTVHTRRIIADAVVDVPSTLFFDGRVMDFGLKVVDLRYGAKSMSKGCHIGDHGA